MAESLEVLAGIAGSGKTAALVHAYRKALHDARQAHTPGQALWLTPGSQSRAAVREKLLDESLPVAFGPNVLTFTDFADRLLAAAPRSVERLAPAAQRILLRRIVARLIDGKQLRYFGGIAGTSGFLDVLKSFIAELKRGETWPDDFEKVCNETGNRPRDRELALIYREYQQVLLDHQLYDDEGRFWSAREALRDGHWGPFGNLSLVVVDGFSDFSRTQYEILQRLAARSQRMVLSLPLESPDHRSDLFAKPREALGRLNLFQDRSPTGPVPVVHWPLHYLDTEATKYRDTSSSLLPSPLAGEGLGMGGQASLDTAETPPPPTPPPSRGRGDLSCVGYADTTVPAFAHITQWLFGNPRDVPTCRDGRGIEILEVAGQGGEVQLLAARIKRLLLSGVPADDIVLAVRDLPDYAELIEEIFAAAGIPFHCGAGISLGRVPVLRFVLNLLQLEAEDWPFRRLLGVLDSIFFRPNWQELNGGRGVREVAAALRALQLDAGRERILSQLPKIVDGGPATGSAPSPDARHLSVAAAQALRLLNRLSQAAKPLRQQHSLLHWAETLDKLVRDLCFPDGGGNRSPGAPAADLADWETLKDLLFSAARAEPLLKGEETRLSLPDFLRELTDLLKSQSVSQSQAGAGVVRVLAAADIRNLDVPRLFLAGLNEKSFPQSRADDCLYNEAERRRLSERGLWLGHRAARTQEEMLLFYNIVTRAREQLVLSYPVVSAEGAPLSPSPYLTALRELFAPDALQVTFDQQLDPVPAPDRILSAADSRIRGMHDALAHRPALFRSLCEQPGFQPSASNILAAVDMNALRFHTPGFTAFEGRLEAAGNIEPLRRRFGPEHEFSATQLETYADCPFRFFLSQVLKIEPLTGVEIETDFGSRGTLIHALLADLHREFFGGPDAAEKHTGLPATETVLSRFHELLHERLGRQPNRSELHQALLRIEDRLLSEWGEAFALQWNSYFQSLPADSGVPMRPAGFEVPFGSEVPSDAGEPVAPTASSLLFGSKENPVRVGGRIDRIDVGRAGEQTVYTVIDYKTGRRKSHRTEDVQAGRVLQLVLYGLAVQRLDLAGSGARPFQLGYWHIRETGFSPAMKVRKQKGVDTLPELEEDVWNALVRTLEEVVPRLAEGIREGCFFVFNEDEDCTAFCPYSTVCRVGQIRALPDELRKRPDM